MHRKSVTLVTLEDGQVQTECIPVQPMRDLRTISGTMEELLELGKHTPSEDYLYVELLDESPVYMPMDRLRPYFPNLLGINSQWLSRVGTGENAALREQLYIERQTIQRSLKHFYNKYVEPKWTRRIEIYFYRRCVERGRTYEAGHFDHAGVWLVPETDRAGFPSVGRQPHFLDYRRHWRRKDDDTGRYVLCTLL